MISTPDTFSTANPPQRRRYPRWHSQQPLAQLVQSSTHITLGHVIDIGLEGFQVNLLQPLASANTTDVTLAFGPSPDALPSLNVKAHPVWSTATGPGGTECAGFHIDDLNPMAAVGILRHIAAHKSDYSVVHEDTERSDRSPRA